MNEQELNVAMAEKIMGFRQRNYLPLRRWHPESNRWGEVWSPSTDLTQAHEVAVRCVEKVGHEKFVIALDNATDFASCDFGDSTIEFDYEGAFNFFNASPSQICHAALAAIASNDNDTNKETL